MSKKIAVIGLGNTLRGDDGVGIAVLDSLRTSHKRSDVDYLNFGIASFDLLHRIRDYDTVVLIDGIEASLPCGTLKIFELEQVEYEMKYDITSSHELGLKEIFAVYKRLNITTKVYVAGIQVEDTSFGEGLTEILRGRCSEITKEIREFLDVLCHTGKSR